MDRCGSKVQRLGQRGAATKMSSRQRGEREEHANVAKENFSTLISV
jgi:hypothetical protein